MKPNLVLLAVLLLQNMAASQVRIVDQSYTPSAPNVGLNVFFPGSNVLTESVLGQSFTPSNDSLAFAGFLLYDATAGVVEGGTLAVRLYEGVGFNGPILGISESLTLPDAFGVAAVGTGGAVVEFNFAPPISLTPGNKYTLRPIRLSGETWVLRYNIRDNPSDPEGYPGGDAVRSAEVGIPGPIETADLYFIEGFVIPEGASLVLLAEAAAGVSMLRRRTA
jgi:hypothetical protein